MIKYRKFKKHYKYKLTEDYSRKLFYGFPDVHSPYIQIQDNTITLLKNYASDGPSGISIDTENFMEGAFVHDALYQCIREGYLPEMYRLEADMEFRLINLDNDMHPFRAWYTYQAVRIFGSFAIRKK